MKNHYTYLFYFEFSKNKISSKNIKSAEEYLKNLSINFDKPTRDSDKKFYILSKSDELNSDPIICLRCRVSKAIYNQCLDVYDNNNNKIDLFDLSRIALIDDGRKNLRINDVSGKIQKYLINYSFLEKNLQNIKIPIFLEIIKTFDYQRSNLNTWTQRIFRGDSEIRNYMRQFNIKFIKIWAKLADTSTKRIRNSLINYGINKSLLDEMICLHESYKTMYKEAKKYYFEKNNTQLGWEPTEKFLRSLDPPQENLDNFRIMEEALNFLHQPEIESSDSEKNKAKIQEIALSEIDNENQSKIRSLMETIKKSSNKVIRNVIKEDKKKWNKDKERKKCWILYSKGMSQREIAEKCNHKQGWVSKLIRENFIGELIANEVLIAIKNKKEFINITKLPDKLDYTKKLIKNQILSLEQITNRSFLMQIVEEELNK